MTFAELLKKLREQCLKQGYVVGEHPAEVFKPEVK